MSIYFFGVYNCFLFQQSVTCPLGPDETPYKNWSCQLVEGQALGNRVNLVIAGCKQHEAAYADWDNNDNPQAFRKYSIYNQTLRFGEFEKVTEIM